MPPDFFTKKQMGALIANLKKTRTVICREATEDVYKYDVTATPPNTSEVLLTPAYRLEFIKEGALYHFTLSRTYGTKLVYGIILLILFMGFLNPLAIVILSVMSGLFFLCLPIFPMDQALSTEIKKQIKIVLKD